MIMAVDITSLFCFVYMPFSNVFVSPEHASRGRAVEPMAERIKNELNLLQERWEGEEYR